MTANIINGGPLSALLTEAQKLAVAQVNISRDRSDPNCSGSLIAPQWVLSARHCTNGGDNGSPSTEVTPNMFVRVGPMTGSRPAWEYEVDEIHYREGSSDIALIKLKGDVVAEHPEIQPLGLTKSVPDASWDYSNPDMHSRFEAAGFGLVVNSDGFGNGVSGRNFVSIPLFTYTSEHFRIFGELNRGVCGGDSGGPLLILDDDGIPRIAGSLFRSFLSADVDRCVNYDNYNRVDTDNPDRAWVNNLVCGEPNGSCIGVRNSCRSSRDVSRDSNNRSKAQLSPLEQFNACNKADELVKCNNGKPQITKCRGGLICAWNKRTSEYGCIDPKLDPCRTDAGEHVQKTGLCDGNTAVWCDYDPVENAARLHRRDCSSCNASCALVAGVGTDCRQNNCNGTTPRGVCEGNTAVWCDANGQAVRQDCNELNTTCGDVSGFIRCIPDDDDLS